MENKKKSSALTLVITIILSIISMPFSVSAVNTADINFSEAIYVSQSRVKNLDSGVSSWAADLFGIARGNALIPVKISGIETYQDLLTAELLSFLVVNMYQCLVPEYKLPIAEDLDNPFTDLNEYYSRDIDTGAYIYHTYHQYPLYARELNLMSGVSADKFAPNETVNREYLASVMVNLLRAAGVSVDGASEAVLEQFNDKNDIADWVRSRVAFVVGNNYMSGAAVNEFRPKDKVTVEQAIAALTRIFERNAEEVAYKGITVTSHKQNELIPKNDLTVTWSDPEYSDNAVSYTVRIIAQYGTQSIYSDYINGSSGDEGNYTATVPYNRLYSDYNDNKEFYIVITDSNGRFSEPVHLFFESQELLISNIHFVRESGSVSLEWLPAAGATDYSVNIVEMRGECSFDPLMPANPNNRMYSLAGMSRFSTGFNANRYYHLTISSNNGKSVKLLFYIGSYRQIQKTELSSDEMRFPNIEAAQAKMKTIAVKVWKIDNSGSKYASSASLTVHEKVADDIAKIFQEIFEGPEKFPIKDIGGFAWRGNNLNSMHNSGLAVDINSNENFCPRLNVGSFWKPYESPYSITPYGDVVRAFERHGWIWLNGDYMHFSYNGG